MPFAKAAGPTTPCFRCSPAACTCASGWPLSGVAVLTLLVGWAWRVAAEQNAQPEVPQGGREMVLRDDAGNTGHRAGHAHAGRAQGRGVELRIESEDGRSYSLQISPRQPAATARRAWTSPGRRLLDAPALWLCLDAGPGRPGRRRRGVPHHPAVSNGSMCCSTACSALVRAICRLVCRCTAPTKWPNCHASSTLPPHASRPSCARINRCWPMPRTSCAHRSRASAWGSNSWAQASLHPPFGPKSCATSPSWTSWWTKSCWPAA